MSRDTETNTQLERAVLRIREMILRGTLAPGQRVAEAPVAEILRMSRTPVRQALVALAREGLLAEHATRGYIVRTFTAAAILDAIDIRGVLEGLAARRVAEQGAPKTLIRSLRDCLEEGDLIFREKRITENDETLYASMNLKFHELIIRHAGSEILSETLERNNHVPFAGPKALAFDKTNLDEMYKMLWYAHRQHHAIVDALEQGQAARAEALMREHANTVKISINPARTMIGMA